MGEITRENVLLYGVILVKIGDNFESALPVKRAKLSPMKIITVDLLFWR
jgi:hypothetical protein